MPNHFLESFWRKNLKLLEREHKVLEQPNAQTIKHNVFEQIASTQQERSNEHKSSQMSTLLLERAYGSSKVISLRCYFLA